MIEVIVSRITPYPELYSPLVVRLALDASNEDLLRPATLTQAIERAFGTPCSATVALADDPEWGMFHRGKGRFASLDEVPSVTNL